jgi:glutathione peroxidase
MFMRFVTGLFVGLLALSLVGSARADDKEKKMASPLDCKMKGIDGKEVDLSQFKGKVVLFVNVASQCGNTPQYKQLETLHEKFGKEGLIVVGVPANEFGKQEPGTDAEISEFCAKEYGVKFVMLSKVVVKGDGTCPLYQSLTKDSKFKGDITWNFEKFLVGRDGQVAARFKPGVKPDDPKVVKAIEDALSKK